MNFGTLKEFLEFQNGKQNWKRKNGARYWATLRPTTSWVWPGPVGNTAQQGLGARSQCGHHAHGPHGGVAGGGSPVDGRRRGLRVLRRRLGA
jgi:hypothetical protein